MEDPGPGDARRRRGGRRRRPAQAPGVPGHRHRSSSAPASTPASPPPRPRPVDPSVCCYPSACCGASRRLDSVRKHSDGELRAGLDAVGLEDWAPWTAPTRTSSTRSPTPSPSITLDRPAVLNAFTHPMLGEIRDAVETAVADPAVVGIVITGAGRGFCAGLDASVLAATTAGGSSGRPPSADDELPGPVQLLRRAAQADHRRRQRRRRRRRVRAGGDVRPALRLDRPPRSRPCSPSAA